MSDLHVGSERADDAEAAAIERVLATTGPAVARVSARVTLGGMQATASRRHLLLPGLWALQDAVGWISPGGLNSLCLALGVPPAEGYGVATFYDLLRTERPSTTIERRCDDLACLLAIEPPIPTDVDAVESSPCLGQCDRGAASLIQTCGAPPRIETPDREPRVDAGPSPRLLRRALTGAVTSLADYRALGGVVALAAARTMGAEAVVDAVTAAGLRGRGGAAFPTGAKWRAVASETATEKHVVANADESEPGTFKDRVLMERDPFSLIEALAVAGFAVGARTGWIYVRGEYPEAYQRLVAALDESSAAGLLEGITIEIRRGAGAYICGEETALLESIEGYRGEPRNKPPYPTTHGLFGAPTVINNVETLINVLDIVEHGPDAWRSVGTHASPGTRLLCLSGHVEHPGVYERPMGVRLADVIAEAGGVRGARPLQAVLLGGAAGAFVHPDQRDLELSFEAAREAGVGLGSGVVMLFDDTVDLRAVVRRAARFFAHESCGQCVPCRVGTQRQVEVLTSERPDTALLDDLEQVMRDASICGLGHTASSLVRSARTLGVL